VPAYINEEYSRRSCDMTHYLSLIATYRLSDAFRTGVNFKYATGRPFTPVTGSEYRVEYDVYEPLYDPVNSDRYANFRRLDLRFMCFHQLYSKIITLYINLYLVHKILIVFLIIYEICVRLHFTN